MCMEGGGRGGPMLNARHIKSMLLKQQWPFMHTYDKCFIVMLQWFIFKSLRKAKLKTPKEKIGPTVKQNRGTLAAVGCY